MPSPAAFADPAATAPMARAFTLARPAALQLHADALALPGPGLDALLDRISPPGPGLLQVSVASTPGALPAGFPASLISGTAGVPWTAEGTSPVIHLSWPGQRRISSLIVRPAAGLPSTPLTVKITSPDGTRQASIPPGGLVRFTAPLITDRIDVSFPRVRQATIVTSTGQLETLPVRLSQLAVPALADLRPVTPPGSASFTLACGQGPALTIDGRVFATSVSGTIGELSQYLPLQVRLCSPGGTLTLAAGPHTLTAAPGTFAVTDLSLTSPTPASPTPAPQAVSTSRAVTIASWQPDQQHAQHRPGRGLLPGSPRELQLRLGRHAERPGPHPRPPRRLAAGLRRPGRPGGTITLTFRPAATYHLALIISILAALILLAIAAWSFLRRPPAGHNPIPAPGSRSAEPMVVTLYPFLPVQSGSHWSAPRRPGRHAWLGVLAVTALIFVVSGPMALVVPVLAALAWLPWRQRADQPGRTALEPLPLIALAAMVASGVLSAASPSGQGLLGPFGWPAQACALVALAAALIPAAALPPRPRPAAGQAPPPDPAAGPAPPPGEAG